MKDLTNKLDNVPPPEGELPAVEWVGFVQEFKNLINATGQTMDVSILRQIINSVAVGGERTTRTTGQTAQIGEIVIPDNSSGNVTILLPTTGLFVNATVFFEQPLDQLYSVNKLIIGRNGNTIMNIAEDMDVTTNHLRFRMVWSGATWIVYANEVIGTTL